MCGDASKVDMDNIQDIWNHSLFLNQVVWGIALTICTLAVFERISKNSFIVFAYLFLTWIMQMIASIFPLTYLKDTGELSIINHLLSICLLLKLKSQSMSQIIIANIKII